MIFSWILKHCEIILYESRYSHIFLRTLKWHMVNFSPILIRHMTSLVAVGLFYSPWNSAKVHRMLGNPFRWLKSRGTIFWCNQSQEGASFVAVHLMGHFPPLYRQRFCNDTQNRNITFTGVRATFWNSLILCSKHGLGAPDATYIQFLLLEQFAKYQS